MRLRRIVRISIALQVVVAACLATSAAYAQALTGVQCTTPAPQHCAETCAGELLADRGNAIEPDTGREFFLDYPCDLAAGEKVLFILSIHGAGSIGNWQRHYFPALDYKEQYRLVIATPTAAGSGAIGSGPGVRMWMPDTDDAYLHNIVNLVVDRFGRENIGAFWLAGHSQGGMTSNRIVCTDFFRDKVDGWLSLSGGRIGRAEIAPDFFGPDGPPAALTSGDANAPRPGVGVMPDCGISFIFTSGEHEIVELPDTSPIAGKYRCAARERRADIVDSTKGYVSAPRPGRGASWGKEARPGTAEIYVYPDCDIGRLIADVLRIDKGHTEGLEPRVTEALVAMMASAPGGKIAQQPVQAGDLESLAARVQMLEDREAIRSLILAYGEAHDGRDYRAFSELFAAEGEWVGGLGSAQGPEAIFELMDETIGHNPQPGGSGTYHVMTNEQIVIDADRASATTKWIYVTPGDDGSPKWVFLGHYDDEFIRENGTWKFLRREAPADIPSGPPQ